MADESMIFSQIDIAEATFYTAGMNCANGSLTTYVDFMPLHGSEAEEENENIPIEQY